MWRPCTLIKRTAELTEEEKQILSPHTFEDKGQLINSQLKQTQTDINF